MIEFEVILKNGRAFVYADWWSEQDGVVFFWQGKAIVNSFSNVISVKSAQHTLHRTVKRSRPNPKAHLPSRR